MGVPRMAERMRCVCKESEILRRETTNKGRHVTGSCSKGWFSGFFLYRNLRPWSGSTTAESTHIRRYGFYSTSLVGDFISWQIHEVHLPMQTKDSLPKFQAGTNSWHHWNAWRTKQYCVRCSGHRRRCPTSRARGKEYKDFAKDGTGSCRRNRCKRDSTDRTTSTVDQYLSMDDSLRAPLAHSQIGHLMS